MDYDQLLEKYIEILTDETRELQPDDTEDIQRLYSNKILIEKYYNDILSNNAYVTDNHYNISKLVINLFSALKTISQSITTVVKPDLMTEDMLNLMLASFAFDDYKYMTLNNKRQFLFDLVSFYIHKGTPETIVKILNYVLGITADIIPLWLTRDKETDELYFYGYPYLNNNIGENIGYITRDYYDTIDGHWMLDYDEIVEIDKKSNFPEETSSKLYAPPLYPSSGSNYSIGTKEPDYNKYELSLPSLSPYFMLAVNLNLNENKKASIYIASEMKKLYDLFLSDYSKFKTYRDISFDEFGQNITILEAMLAYSYLYNMKFSRTNETIPDDSYILHYNNNFNDNSWNNFNSKYSEITEKEYDTTNLHDIPKSWSERNINYNDSENYFRTIVDKTINIENDIKNPKNFDNCAICYDEKYIYLSGGFNSSTGEYNNWLYRFDMDEYRWKKLIQLPKRLTRHSMIYLNGFIIIQGGMDNTSNPNYNQYILDIEPRKLQWDERILDTQYHRLDSKLIRDSAYENIFYMIMGYKYLNNTFDRDIICFDFNKNEIFKITEFPEEVGRIHFAVECRNRNIFISGGMNPDYLGLLTGININDQPEETDEWKIELSSPSSITIENPYKNTQRKFNIELQDKETIIITKNQPEYIHYVTNTGYVYDLENNIWYTISNEPYHRCGHYMINMDNNDIVLLGGYIKEESQFLKQDVVDTIIAFIDSSWNETELSFDHYSIYQLFADGLFGNYLKPIFYECMLPNEIYDWQQLKVPNSNKNILLDTSIPFGLYNGRITIPNPIEVNYDISGKLSGLNIKEKYVTLKKWIINCHDDFYMEDYNPIECLDDIFNNSFREEKENDIDEYNNEFIRWYNSYFIKNHDDVKEKLNEINGPLLGFCDRLLMDSDVNFNEIVYNLLAEIDIWCSKRNIMSMFKVIFLVFNEKAVRSLIDTFKPAHARFVTLSILAIIYDRPHDILAMDDYYDFFGKHYIESRQVLKDLFKIRAKIILNDQFDYLFHFDQTNNRGPIEYIDEASDDTHMDKHYMFDNLDIKKIDIILVTLLDQFQYLYSFDQPTNRGPWNTPYTGGIEFDTMSMFDKLDIQVLNY